MRLTSKVLLLVALCAATPARAQFNSMDDFSWTLTGGEYGIAQLDLDAGTMFIYANDAPFLYQPFMAFETMAPYDGTVTVGITTIAHDPEFDWAIGVVGEDQVGLVASTGETTLSFEVFADTTFGLGVQGDDCCDSIEVLYHDFVFTPKTPTPAVSPALDVRLDQVAPAQHLYWAQMDVLGDVNGDDVADFVLGGVDDVAVTHGLSVISGADLSVIFSLSGPSTVHWGEYVSSFGDFNLDGVPDYLTGDSYSCEVRSGSNNTVLATFFNFDYAGSISGACGAGDIDLDGVPDLWLLGFSALQLVSGAGGDVIHTLSTPNGTPGLGQNGDPLDRLADVDGDGLDDVVLGLPPQQFSPLASQVWVVSSGTGLTVQEHVAAADTLLGWAVASAGDVDGDGVDDVVAGAPRALDGRGEAFVWSGATGTELRHVTGSAHAGLGGAVDGAGDVNGDGLADFLLGNRANESGVAQPQGRVELRSGADGTLLQLFEQPAQGNFGRALVGDVDLDLDGAPELVVAALRDGPKRRLWRYDDLALPYGVASLVGSGTLLPGAPFTLQLTGGPPAGVAHLVAGLSWLAAPFKGGTLIPQPDLVLLGLPLGAHGQLTLTGTWPAGIPSGTLLAVQYWLPDVHGPAGFGASNGVLFLVP
jgi:uncharacterized Zn-binding protein involved in type VI secretion